MSTHGQLTVGKLKKYLDGFPDDTKVVLGQIATGYVLQDCHANTYCPPEHEGTVWVILDVGKN